MDEIVVFGVGNNTNMAISEGSLHLDSIKFFFVSYHSTVTGRFMGKPLYSLDEALEHYNDEKVFIVAHDYGEVFRILKSRGIRPSRTYAYVLAEQNNPVFSSLDYPCEPRFINVGGGYFFHYDNWLNLESSGSYLYPFQLTAACRFPPADKSIELVYSSHCFEHLESLVIDRVMQESERCLVDGGKMLIVLPDFDSVFNAWKTNLESSDILSMDNWNFKNLVGPWARYGVQNSRENRALCILASIDLSARSTLFETNPNIEDYIGPVILTDEELTHVRKADGPGEATKRMIRIAGKKYPDAVFIHQSSWSTDEFVHYVASFGFRCVSTCKSQLLNEYEWIPLVEKIQDLSNYYLFEKK